MEETWQVIDVRVSLQRAPERDHQRIHVLGHRGRYLLDRDQQRHVADTVTTVEILLTSDPPPDKVGVE